MSRVKKDERKLSNERGKLLDWVVVVGSGVFFFFFEKLQIQILVFFLNFNGGANMEAGMTLSWRHEGAIWA